MKSSKILCAFVLSAFSISAQAGSFIECRNFGGTFEYRSGINLDKKTAAFFDGETVSFLKLVNENSDSIVFLGPDESDGGTLTLTFKFQEMTATLTSQTTGGEVETFNTNECTGEKAWDELK